MAKRQDRGGGIFQIVLVDIHNRPVHRSEPFPAETRKEAYKNLLMFLEDVIDDAVVMGGHLKKVR